MPGTCLAPRMEVPLLLSLLLAASMAEPAPRPARCSLIFPVAPDEAAARRVAEAVIAVRPHPSSKRYDLRVERDRDDLGQWLAFQSLPRPRRREGPGWVLVTAGGGGLAMRIDSCTGAVSRLHYSR